VSEIDLIDKLQKIVLVLSMTPSEGGKFQYSLNMLFDLAQAKSPRYKISVIYFDKVWEKYLTNLDLPACYVEKIESIIYRVLRKLFLKVMHSVAMIRILSKFCSKIYKVINDLQPDYVIYPGNDSFAYEFDFKSIIPIFDLMHRYEKFKEVCEHGEYKSREFHYNYVAKYAAGVLVDSEIGYQQVLECYNIDEKKLLVYRYKPPYYVTHYQSVDINKKYKLPKHYIFYPAQFWSHKNHKIIIEALKIINNSGHDLSAVFVGEKKNAFDEVQMLIKEKEIEDNIFVLGYVNNDDLVSLYKNAIALVFPSFFGPTNIPPLEAIALDCPVLCADVYAAREQLADAAIYFNPRKTTELVDSLKLILLNPEKSNDLRKRGRIRLSEILLSEKGTDIEKVLSQLENI